MTRKRTRQGIARAAGLVAVVLTCTQARGAEPALAEPVRPVVLARTRQLDVTAADGTAYTLGSGCRAEPGCAQRAHTNCVCVVTPLGTLTSTSVQFGTAAGQSPSTTQNAVQ